MRPESYRLAYDKARLELGKRDPHDIVARSEVRFEPLGDGRGEFEITYFGKKYVATYPEGLVLSRSGGEEASIETKIILLHYLLTADGFPLTGQWLNFRRLPGGLLYQSAFEDQCLAPLAREFGHDLSRFLEAGEAAGGERTRLGDSSFLFRVLPRFIVICVLWLGDDELPPSVDFLFDESTPHYLSTEDVDVLCREIGKRLARQPR